MCSNPASRFKRRFIDLRYRYVLGHVTKKGSVTLQHVPSGDMIADVFTKGLPFQLFTQLQGKLGIQSLAESTPLASSGTSAPG